MALGNRFGNPFEMMNRGRRAEQAAQAVRDQNSVLNPSQQSQQQAQPFMDYATGIMGNPSNVQNWQNPYAGQMKNIFGQMGNAPGAQQGAQNWQSQFGGQMQTGQNPINFNMPQWSMPNVGRPGMAGATQNFMGLNPQQMQFNPASLGQGGDIMSRIASMQMPGSGNFSPFDLGQTQGARTQQLGGITSLMNQPGMSNEQINTIAQGAFNPVADMLRQREAESLSGASARGMGRSSAYDSIRGDTSRDMANTYGGIMGGLTQQNVGLTNQNRLSALQGLGDFTGQGLQSEALGLQGQNQMGNFMLGQGGLAGNLAGMTQGGQQFSDQMNLAGQGQNWNQLMGQAGMGADIYNADSNRALQEAGMQQRERMGADDNFMRMLGMGAQGAGQDYGQLSNRMSQYLNAAGQNQNAWGTAQGNRIGEEGQRGGFAGNMWGNITGNDLANRQFGDQSRLNWQQLALQRKQQEGGGLGGFLGGALGTLAGSALGPIGAGLGGKLGSSIFGGGGGGYQPIQQPYYPNMNYSGAGQEYMTNRPYGYGGY